MDEVALTHTRPLIAKPDDNTNAVEQPISSDIKSDNYIPPTKECFPSNDDSTIDEFVPPSLISKGGMVGGFAQTVVATGGIVTDTGSSAISAITNAFRPLNTGLEYQGSLPKTETHTLPTQHDSPVGVEYAFLSIDDRSRKLSRQSQSGIGIVANGGTSLDNGIGNVEDNILDNSAANHTSDMPTDIKTNDTNTIEETNNGSHVRNATNDGPVDAHIEMQTTRPNQDFAPSPESSSTNIEFDHTSCLNEETQPSVVNATGVNTDDVNEIGTISDAKPRMEETHAGSRTEHGSSPTSITTQDTNSLQPQSPSRSTASSSSVSFLHKLLSNRFKATTNPPSSAPIRSSTPFNDNRNTTNSSAPMYNSEHAQNADIVETSAPDVSSSAPIHASINSAQASHVPSSSPSLPTYPSSAPAPVAERIGIRAGPSSNIGCSTIWDRHRGPGPGCSPSASPMSRLTDVASTAPTVAISTHIPSNTRSSAPYHATSGPGDRGRNIEALDPGVSPGPPEHPTRDYADEIHDEKYDNADTHMVGPETVVRVESRDDNPGFTPVEDDLSESNTLPCHTPEVSGERRQILLNKAIMARTRRTRDHTVIALQQQIVELQSRLSTTEGASQTTDISHSGSSWDPCTPDEKTNTDMFDNTRRVWELMRRKHQELTRMHELCTSLETCLRRATTNSTKSEVSRAPRSDDTNDNVSANGNVNLLHDRVHSLETQLEMTSRECSAIELRLQRSDERIKHANEERSMTESGLKVAIEDVQLDKQHLTHRLKEEKRVLAEQLKATISQLVDENVSLRARLNPTTPSRANNIERGRLPTSDPDGRVQPLVNIPGEDVGDIDHTNSLSSDNISVRRLLHEQEPTSEFLQKMRTHLLDGGKISPEQARAIEYKFSQMDEAGEDGCTIQ